MSRLIDADALIRRAIERYKENMGTDIGHGMGVIASMITDSPTIDAVAVVRCAECKFFKYGDYCTQDKMEHSQCREDDFCSYGKRREVDSDDRC